MDSQQLVLKISNSGRANKTFLPSLMKEILQTIDFTDEYIKEQSNTFLILYKGKPIAGVSSASNFSKVEGFGNFKKLLPDSFWDDLADLTLLL